MFKLISKDYINETHSRLFGCFKQQYVRSTCMTQTAPDLKQIVTSIYAQLGSYMENAIVLRSLRKMKTMNITLQINLKLNEKLYGENDLMHIVDGDKVETDTDGTTTHSYFIVTDGVINTDGQFMKFIHKNNHHTYIAPLKFAMDRICILNMMWELLVKYTPTYW